MRKALHFLAFLVLLSLWTWKLLEPIPVPETVTSGWSDELKFVLAKTLHTGVYAFLAIFGIMLSHRWRWWIVGLLMLHAVGTEIGQTYVPNRTGSVRDVLLDWAGIACGVVLVWCYCRSRRCDRNF